MIPRALAGEPDPPLVRVAAVRRRGARGLPRGDGDDGAVEASDAAERRRRARAEIAARPLEDDPAPRERQGNRRARGDSNALRAEGVERREKTPVCFRARASTTRRQRGGDVDAPRGALAETPPPHLAVRGEREGVFFRRRDVRDEPRAELLDAPGVRSVRPFLPRRRDEDATRRSRPRSSLQSRRARAREDPKLAVVVGPEREHLAVSRANRRVSVRGAHTRDPDAPQRPADAPRRDLPGLPRTRTRRAKELVPELSVAVGAPREEMAAVVARERVVLPRARVNDAAPGPGPEPGDARRAKHCAVSRVRLAVVQAEPPAPAVAPREERAVRADGDAVELRRRRRRDAAGAAPRREPGRGTSLGVFGGVFGTAFFVTDDARGMTRTVLLVHRGEGDGEVVEAPRLAEVVVGDVDDAELEVHAAAPRVQIQGARRRRGGGGGGGPPREGRSRTEARRVARVLARGDGPRAAQGVGEDVEGAPPGVVLGRARIRAVLEEHRRDRERAVVHRAVQRRPPALGVASDEARPRVDDEPRDARVAAPRRGVQGGDVREPARVHARAGDGVHDVERVSHVRERPAPHAVEQRALRLARARGRRHRPAADRRRAAVPPPSRRDARLRENAASGRSRRRALER